MQADLNVSLTAINLLWNAADLLAKRSVHSLSSDQADSNREATANGVGPGLLDRDNFEELLRFLFQSIQARHSNAKTPSPKKKSVAKHMRIGHGVTFLHP